MNQRRIVVSLESDREYSTTKMANIVTTEEEEEESHRPWSNLPPDVLSEIMRLLRIADQIRLSCVCKNFRRQPIHHDRPADRLPWLVTCHDSESDGFVCKLFDPLQQKPEEVHRISGPSIGGWFRPNYVTSKDGWLLFLREKDRYVDELFMFCPYTKEIIVLPDLHHGFWESRNHWYTAGERMRILTFSSADPRSEDCLFFAAYYLYDNETHGKITICSYRHKKDKEWRTKTTFYAMKFVKNTNLLYMEGNLYIMNKEGCLGIYDVSTERWSFNNYWPNNNGTIDHQRCSLVAHEGTILLLVMNQLSTFELYRLEGSSRDYKEWIRQSGLENQALFLGYYPWECNVLVRHVQADSEFVSNKIFCRKLQEGRFDRRFQLEISYHWKFYDLKESEYLVCECTKFRYFVPREEEKEGLIRPNKNPLALWIEPPNQALNRFIH